jgi:hypothetical protein
MPATSILYLHGVLDILSWRCKQQVPLNRRYVYTKLHSVTPQEH